MSHFSNDMILDNAIIDAVECVNNMSDVKVEQVGFINYGVKGIHRDCLIEKIANDFYADYMAIPGPHG